MADPGGVDPDPNPQVNLKSGPGSVYDRPETLDPDPKFEKRTDPTSQNSPLIFYCIKKVNMINLLLIDYNLLAKKY